MTMVDASRGIDHDSSWLTRIERMERSVHPNDVRALLTLYGIDGPAVDVVVDMARQAKRRGWWHRYNRVMPDWLSNYIGLETDATVIRTWEPQLVPGLLQTERYTRAILTAEANPDSSEQRIDERVALRIERQAILASDDPPQVRVVLDEAVLHRCIGSADVMREQAQHLLKVSERPNILIQVLPFSTGTHAGMDGSFVILDMPPPPAHFPVVACDKIVYLDTLLAAIYLEQPDEVAAYAATFEEIRADALGPQESRELLLTHA